MGGFVEGLMYYVTIGNWLLSLVFGLTDAVIAAVCAAGGGNVLNVQRTVRQLINVGAKGCFLEDQKWPKKTGRLRNKEVIGMDEFAAKVGAAVAGGWWEWAKLGWSCCCRCLHDSLGALGLGC